MKTQRDLDSATRGSLSALAGFSTELAAKDADFRGLLDTAPTAVSSATNLVSDLRPTLPLLLTNFTTLGGVMRTYLPNLEQTLLLYPVTVIAELLGFPPSDYTKIKKWSDEMAEALRTGDFDVGLLRAPTNPSGLVLEVIAG